LASPAGAGLAGVAAAAGFSGEIFVSDGTGPEGVAFTPPGVAGLSAVGFGSLFGGGGVGDLGSSGIARETGKPPARAAFAKNDNFYQLEGMVSTEDECIIRLTALFLVMSF
jgi:hypothetical protein